MVFSFPQPFIIPLASCNTMLYYVGIQDKYIGMKKEVSKVEEKKETISDVMSRYDASFSISLREGFAHIKFIDQKMYVTWLNDEGYIEEEGQDVPLEDIERIAGFMSDLKALRLTDYEKKN